MTLLQLNPPFEVTTPKGYGIAHILDSRGDELDAVWGVAQEDGQFWWWPNSKIRFHKNITQARYNPEVVPLDHSLDQYKLDP